jgi:hypothetical protein
MHFFLPVLFLISIFLIVAATTGSDERKAWRRHEPHAQRCYSQWCMTSCFALVFHKVICWAKKKSSSCLCSILFCSPTLLWSTYWMRQGDEWSSQRRCKECIASISLLVSGCCCRWTSRCGFCSFTVLDVRWWTLSDWYRDKKNWRKLILLYVHMIIDELSVFMLPSWTILAVHLPALCSEWWRVRMVVRVDGIAWGWS